jgi:hypothetical protein
MCIMVFMLLQLCVALLGATTAAAAPQHHAVWHDLFGANLTHALFDDTAPAWESHLPLHAPRDTAARFESLFHLRYLDMVLDASPPIWTRAGNVRIVKRVECGGDAWTGSLPADNSNSDRGHPDSATVRAAFRRGFTVVVNRMDRRWPPLARLARAISASLGYRCSVNLYLTPGASAQGFEPHFDSMQSIVVQLAGTKQWALYEWPRPMPQPLYGDTFKIPRRLLDNALLAHAPARLDMTPGSVLYLPSGLVHEARTLPAPVSGGSVEPSLHLTIGVEVDALFTTAGFLHLLLARLDRASELGAELDAPAALCASHQSSPRWRWRHWLHLALHATTLHPESVALRKTAALFDFSANASSSSVSTNAEWHRRPRAAESLRHAWTRFRDTLSLANVADTAFLCRMLASDARLASLGVDAVECAEMATSELPPTAVAAAERAAPFRLTATQLSWMDLPLDSDAQQPSSTLEPPPSLRATVASAVQACGANVLRRPNGTAPLASAPIEPLVLNAAWLDRLEAALFAERGALMTAAAAEFARVAQSELRRHDDERESALAAHVAAQRQWRSDREAAARREDL